MSNTPAINTRIFLFFSLFAILSFFFGRQKLVVGTDGFSPEKIAIIKQAAQDWDEVYSCKKILQVDLLEGDFPPGLIERSIPRRIWLNPKLTNPQIRNAILHSMTHACSSKNPWFADKPFPYSNGWIFGYQGASVLLKTNAGEETKFRLIEEGIAERNASIFSGYSTIHPEYINIRQLAIKQFSETTDIMSIIGDNDFKKISSIILEKSENVITPVDIENAMKLYEAAK
jgi:hypothetical protein